MKPLLTISLLLIILHGFGQGTNEPVTISSTTYNMMVYKPSEYAANPTKKYPLIVNLVGSGETGSDATKTYTYGPNWAINNGWNGEVTLGDSTFKCIVITFQRDANSSSPAITVRAIDTMLTRYRIDTARLYLTGLSLGAQTAVRKFTEQGLTASNRWKYNRFNASVLFSEGKNIGGNSHADLNFLAAAGGSIFMLRGENDGLTWSTDSITNNMNPVRPGSALGYDWTTAEAGGDTHCCWNTFYDEDYVSPLTGLTIYQYMLGHSKRPYASAGQSAINTTSSSATLNGISRQYSWGWNGWGTLTKLWTKVSGPSATINSASSDTTTVDLTGGDGEYVFRFTTQTESGLTATHDVTVTKSSESVPEGAMFIKKRGRKLKIVTD